MAWRKTWSLGAIYQTVHSALWALLIAVLLVFVIFYVPQMPERRAAAAAARALDLAEEERAFCEKWGIPATSSRHTACTLDVRSIRTNALQRLEEDIGNF